MRQKTIFTVPVLFLLAASPALATPMIARAPTPEEPKDRSTDIGVGMLLGGLAVGDLDGDAVGMQFSLGRRFGAWTVAGEFSYLGISHKEETKPPGTQTRVGLTGRYNILRFAGRKAPLMGTVWLEGGIGMERVRWDEGGVLTRPDAALGFGFTWAGVLDRRNPKKKKSIGWFAAFRVHFAQAPRMTTVSSTCAGPCDRATGPSRNDVSMFANFGVHWGRY